MSQQLVVGVKDQAGNWVSGCTVLWGQIVFMPYPSLSPGAYISPLLTDEAVYRYATLSIKNPGVIYDYTETAHGSWMVFPPGYIVRVQRITAPPPKAGTVLTISASPATITSGESFTVTGRLTDRSGTGVAGRSVRIDSRRDGVAQAPVYRTTDSGGYFSYTFSSPMPGTWTVQASFEGDSSYEGSTSGSVTVEVLPPIIPTPLPGLVKWLRENWPVAALAAGALVVAVAVAVRR